MLILKVLGDGTILPKELKKCVMIQLENGDFRVGYFNQEHFKQNQDCLDVIKLSKKLEIEIRQWLTNENPDVFLKKHPLYIMLPPFLLDKIINSTIIQAGGQSDLRL